MHEQVIQNYVRFANFLLRFITSDNHNLKYMGVNALASIVQVNPKYVSEHQMVVIDANSLHQWE